VKSSLLLMLPARKRAELKPKTKLTRKFLMHIDVTGPTGVWDERITSLASLLTSMAIVQLLKKA
jgi:RNase H-fold protein (predicted Holliday junction resolvase)